MQNLAKQIWQVLTPSWLSGLIVGLADVTVVGGTLVVSNYQGSRLQQELFEARSGGAALPTTDFHTVTDNLARNSIVSNLPLFLFWAFLGVIVYLFATSLWGALTKVEALREEMAYVNAPKHQLARDALAQLIIRLAVLGVWVTYLQLFLKVLLPYALAAGHIAAVNLISLSGLVFTVLALTVLFAALHLHATFLRLLLLKTRAFG